jgi:hypothetical protein
MSDKNSKQIVLSFNPKQVTKRLVGVLSDRGRDVINGRYGLGSETKKMTLESIGKKYGITRERVRQIENHSIANIRKSKEYEKERKVFEELKAALRFLGGIISEHDALHHFSADKATQNHIHFLLVIGEDFKKHKEDEEFKARWHIDNKLAEKIHDTLRKIYTDLNDEAIVPESEIIKSFLTYITDVSEEYKNEEMIKRYLNMSKSLGKNPLGEWGKTRSSNINTRGVRDYAFLVIRKHGSPIHFREVARLITEVFNKKAHVATTHNELIKDPRFVLVGRGLYALAEWGYMSGVVKDVIKKVLEKEGPLTKEKIIEKVMKERYVKPNTILVNLQNTKFFKKDKQNRYSLA